MAEGENGFLQSLRIFWRDGRIPSVWRWMFARLTKLGWKKRIH